jgi:hypothetical protein
VKHSRSTVAAALPDKVQLILSSYRARAGRKVDRPGSARLVYGRREVTAADPARSFRRAGLEQRRQGRVERFRFRRDPDAHRRDLEAKLIQTGFPSQCFSGACWSPCAGRD